MINPFLVGPKIYLRPLDRGDAPTFVTWMNDSDLSRYLPAGRPMTLRAEEEFIDSLAGGERISLGIVLRDGDRLIGSTGLRDIHARCRKATFGIIIGPPEERGKGYGTEVTRLMVGYAFETLNMNKVCLHVYEYNPRGVRTYEKVGFQREGVLRQETYRDGRYWDIIVMGILREEWKRD